jgi:hypothetical protein
MFVCDIENTRVLCAHPCLGFPQKLKMGRTKNETLLYTGGLFVDPAGHNAHAPCFEIV